MNVINENICQFSQENVNGKLLRYASQNSLDECSQKQLPYNKTREKPFYKNVHHPKKAFESLNILRMQNILCDVILVVEDFEVSVHRVVLASCSSYFCAMFTKFEERKLERIILKDIESSALQLIVQYIYTSEIQINEDNVQSMLPAANLLQLNDIKDACCDFLESQLHPSNCLGIKTFADIHSCLNLLLQTEKFIEEHFSEVIEGDEFLSLSIEQMIQLIQNDNLVISKEEMVFECVVNWIKYDVDNRKIHLPLLMEHVRLPLTSKDFVLKVDDEPLVRENLQCKDFIIEALKYHLMNIEKRVNLKTIRTIPRRAHNTKALLVVGGQAPKAICSVECFNLKERKWYAISEMPSRRCRAGIALLNNQVYAIGGFNGSLRVKTVDIYDVLTNQWSTGVPMEVRRSTLGVAVIGNKIYAVGGFDGTAGLETAEVFDPETQCWNPITPMSTRRSSVGVGVLNNLLYAIGGYDGTSRQCLSSVECYNPGTNSWHLIAEMNSKRSGAGVGVMDGVLYAVGGHDGPVVRNSVEKFDPIDGTWKTVADMELCRRNAGVVSYDGLLYVVGGDDGTTNLQSIEVYCSKTNTWTLLPESLGIGRSYAGVTLIDKPSYLL